MIYCFAAQKLFTDKRKASKPTSLALLASNPAILALFREKKTGMAGVDATASQFLTKLFLWTPCPACVNGKHVPHSVPSGKTTLDI